LDLKKTFRKERVSVMRKILWLIATVGAVALMAAPAESARLRGGGGGGGGQGAAAGGTGAGANLTDEDVTRAIERGREWLTNQQQGGKWEEKSYWHSPNACGHTEISGLTLLYTGSHPINSALMVQTLDYLMGNNIEYTYARCCRTMAYAAALKNIHSPGPRRDTIRKAIVADAQWLVNAQHSNADQSGGWTYQGLGDPEFNHRIDFSNTQFAILALWEASKVGVEVPNIIWERTLDLYKRNQQQDGSWNYGPHTEADGAGYGSMTAAGLATLYICMDMLDLASGCPCRGARAGGDRADLERRMALAFKWLEDHFTAETNPGGAMSGWRMYWLYAVERVGMATGYKYLGSHDWYREGCATVLAQQNGDGSWPGEAEGGPIPTTCFAVLFLYKGRAPILFNKLQETPGGETWKWNPHRRDIPNLVSYFEKVKEEAFTWQVVNLKGPMEELHDAPILYISAETAPKFTDEEKKKLRAFTDTGGTILVEPSCGASAVKDWFNKFAKEVWPEWPVKPLGPDHGSFLDPYPLKQRPEILGINDGMRTCVFYALDDISCPWQTKAYTLKEFMFQWGVNLFTYATDHSPLRAKLAPKEASKSDRFATAVKAGDKATVKMARLKTDGDWFVNRNYKGFEYISAEVNKKGGITLTVQEEGLDVTALTDQNAAYLTGSKEFTMGAADQTALKAYLAKGGFLWAEAAGGSSAFDGSMLKLAKDMGWQLKALDKSAPVMSGRFTKAVGYNLTTGLQFRRVLKLQRIESGRLGAELTGIYAEGKLVGIYSPYDITFSATPYEAYACKGYKPEDAAAVATNILALITDK
jgi:hypothetical protein